MRPSADHAVPGQNHRPLGRSDAQYRALHLSRERLRRERRLDEKGAFNVPLADLLGRYIFGQLQMSGSGLFGLGDLEGLPHRLRNDVWSRDLGVPFRHRLEHRDKVDVLMRFLVHPI